jgi:DNA modification methylase
LLINGDSLVELAKLQDNTVDLIVTDPPYGYSFMGKEWDKALPDKRIWKECLRVLKAGGFAYVMSAPRQDVLARMMIDLEDVGFKIDFTSMYWAYATGFPKAMNMSKAIDKKLGVERKVLGKRNDGVGKVSESGIYKLNNANSNMSKEVDITESGSPQAKKMDGSYAGFQPKPAVEVIIVCMKPIEEKGYIDQALANGKGVSWFDDCRIPSDSNEHHRNTVEKAETGDDMVFKEGSSGFHKKFEPTNSDKGRYPANLLVSDNAVDIGKITKSPHNDGVRQFSDTVFNLGLTTGIKREIGDSGDFSRYFDIDKWWESQFIITPKASKSEKNKGLDDFEDKKGKGQWNIEDNGNATAGMGNHNPLCLKCNCYRTAKLKSKPSCICDNPEWRTPKNLSTKNNHPTVKPLKLMSYLITLGSREGDTVLDPFMGSGTTPLASKQMGRKYIGIEREEEYYKICCARVGDEPTLLEETPIEEKVEETKIIEEPKIVEEVVKENNICSLCGVNYTGMTLEAHEARKFHQEYV